MVKSNSYADLDFRKGIRIKGIPPKWDWRNWGQIGQFISGTSFPTEYQGKEEGDYPFFKVSDMNIPGNERWLSQSNNYIDDNEVEELGASIVPEGSIVLPKVGAALLTNKRRIVSQPSIIDNNIVAFNPVNCLNTYLFWLLNTVDLRPFAALGPVPSISRSSLSQIRLPIPEQPLQEKISSFLDVRTSLIDELIGKKEDLVDLLLEKQTSVITDAITTGLDSSTTLKSPTTKWLNEIPSHWETRRLDHLRDPNIPIVYGIILPGPDQDEGVPIIKGGDCVPEKLHPEKLSKTTSEIASDYQRSRLKPGDLVYEIRGSIGRVVKVPPELEGANLTQDTARISPKDDVNEDWLIFALQSEMFHQQMDLHARGATVRGVNLFDLRRGIIPVPPRKEQDEIAAYLQQWCELIEDLVEKTRDGISLLEEKKSTIITATVTGQLDVSDWEPLDEKQEATA